MNKSKDKVKKAEAKKKLEEARKYEDGDGFNWGVSPLLLPRSLY